MLTGDSMSARVLLGAGFEVGGGPKCAADAVTDGVEVSAVLMIGFPPAEAAATAAAALTVGSKRARLGSWPKLGVLARRDGVLIETSCKKTSNLGTACAARFTSIQSCSPVF